MGEYIKRRANKSIKKIVRKVSKHLLLFFLPILIILFVFFSIADFFFFHIPKTVNAEENKEMKNYAMSITDEANISNLHLEDGTKLHGFCDANGKDLELALKWSDLYAMVLLEDNTSIESFNMDKNNTFVKKRFNVIAKDLAPSITYIKSNRKVTLTTTVEERDKDGKVIGTKTVTSVVSNEVVYNIKSADTLYGKYSYQYETKTETRTDSAGTWTTTYLSLTNSEVTDQYKRLDNYLKAKLKLTDRQAIEDTRQQFIELSAGIYNDSENGGWLIGEGGLGNGGLSWSAIGATNISPEIMDAIMFASNKYSIPPWLIMGFIYRESGFRSDIISCDDLGGRDVKINDVKNDIEYMNNPKRSLGLMQVTIWKTQAELLGYNYIIDSLNPKVQIDVGCNELVNQKFSLFKINPKTVDWKDNGWIEQTWLGCQAYNGLIYYNTNPSKTRAYAFSKYLRRPDGTGVFDMAEKYKSMFEINANGGYTKKTSWPTPGYYTVSSPFGWRIHPIFNTKKHHNGIDIAAPMGAKITSSSNGVVVQASDLNNGYGKCVIVKNDKYEYLYAHMSNITVKVGETVTVGKELGKVGSTGYSTGPHLHFGISLGDHYNNKWIDPLTIVSH